MEREYIGYFEFSGGFGHGYGGTYAEELKYNSKYRANSKSNQNDAIRQFHQIKGRTFSSVRLIETRLIR